MSWGICPSTPMPRTCSFSRWGEIFADDTIAAAMIDRLVHHAEVHTLDGESYRTKTRRELLESTTPTTP